MVLPNYMHMLIATSVRTMCILMILPAAGMEQPTRSGAAWQTYGARWATLLALVQVLCSAQLLHHHVACQSYSMQSQVP